eukprot:2798540-Pleurochrysis_carterae.AAC.2
MGIVYDLLEDAKLKIAQDGAYLFEPSLHILESVADEQPLFKPYIDKEMREEMVRSPDGKHSFSKYESVLAEAQTPSDSSNIAATTATIDVLKVMAVIAKMRDPKMSVADKLTSQEGSNAYYNNEEAHAAALGAQNTNDAVEVHAQLHARTSASLLPLSLALSLARSLALSLSLSRARAHARARSLSRACAPAANFGRLDHVLCRFRGISSESASSLAQQMRMHSFDEGDARDRRKGKKNGKTEQRELGYFHTLPTGEQNAAVLAAIAMRAAVRVEARADLAEQQECFALMREQASQRQLKKLVAEYVKAMATQDKYKAPGRAAPTMAAAHAKVARLGSVAAQHAYIREQIEMRVLGLGLA